MRVLLLLCLAVLVYADKLDDLVAAQMEKHHVPGLAIAVIRDGEPIRVQAYGIANLEHSVPVTPKTVFKLASVSKHFFAAAILLLIEDGKLTLEDPVRKHIDDAPAAWDGITIRHLLSHTSGLVRECPAFDPFRTRPEIDLVRSAFAVPLVFQPGERYQYSNTGYFTAAEIVSRLSGRQWPDFVAERLFRPAGLTVTRPTSTTMLVPNRAAGYEWTGTGYRNALDYIAVRPSGAFLSTLDDMVRWDSALNAETPLSKKLRNVMWTPVMLNDGKPSGNALGWLVGEIHGRQVTHHGGSLPGFRTHYARFLTDKLSIIILANSSSAPSSELVWKVAALFLPERDQLRPSQP